MKKDTFGPKKKSKITLNWNKARKGVIYDSCDKKSHKKSQYKLVIKQENE